MGNLEAKVAVVTEASTGTDAVIAKGQGTEGAAVSSVVDANRFGGSDHASTFETLADSRNVYAQARLGF
ncbi:MAG: hypothetical protein HY303_07250 [Candidatus Wallbacteria bacterium]|nr:hypothetical protein [Candidatus Wallbacteria bacterium]